MKYTLHSPTWITSCMLFLLFLWRPRTWIHCTAARWRQTPGCLSVSQGQARKRMQSLCQGSLVRTHLAPPSLARHRPHFICHLGHGLCWRHEEASECPPTFIPWLIPKLTLMERRIQHNSPFLLVLTDCCRSNIALTTGIAWKRGGKPSFQKKVSLNV